MGPSAPPFFRRRGLDLKLAIDSATNEKPVPEEPPRERMRFKFSPQSPQKMDWPFAAYSSWSKCLYCAHGHKGWANVTT
eukprot:4882553-Pleurochrysis_carterae.AAC.1